MVLGALAILLAAINLILLIIRVIDKRVNIGVALLIVLGSIVIPYVIAIIAASFATGWNRAGLGIITWAAAGLVAMVSLMAYLSMLEKPPKQIPKSKKENPELLDD